MCKYFYAYTNREREKERGGGERERENHHMRKNTNHIWDSVSLAKPQALKHHPEYCTLI